MHKALKTAWVVAAMFAPATALAYLDPSTGSMVISAIVGLFASLALALKTYWYKLVRLFRRDRTRSDGSNPGPTD